MQYKCYKNCKLIFITLPFLSKVKHTRNIINQKKIYSDVKSLSTSLKSLNLEKKGKKDNTQSIYLKNYHHSYTINFQQ